MGAINCTKKGWNWRDTLNGMFTNGFTAYSDLATGEAEGEQGASSLKLVNVEDSGDPYYCNGKKFEGWDTLAKELTGFYSGSEGETALRVSLGVPTSEANRCALPGRSYTIEERIIKSIGRGTDGGPVLRLSVLLFPAS